MLLEKPMSGYDIKQYIEIHFPFFFVASYGTIYPTLNKMEKEGYITKQLQIQEGKPNKNVYSITEKGKEAFRAYLDSPVEPLSIRFDFIMRMHFGHHAEMDKIILWIEEEIRRTKLAIAHIEEVNRLEEKRMTPTKKICYRVGINHYTNYLATMEEALQELKASLID
ncbi:PadR family transcriptional regulator [Desulfofarcimen acetoxidans]|nr:PadR family transcriptional regulator [Desulfofarcimen acetoxidans]